jgi:hypothetical protein
MQAMQPKQVENGVVIHIRVKLHARKFAIKLRDGQIVVEVRSPPIEGKANEEVIRGLSDFFEKPVQLLKGHKSRQKTLLIQRTALAEVQSRLRAPLGK